MLKRPMRRGDTLELESNIYFRAELSSPFSIAVPENANVVRFHIVSAGRCWVQVAGENAVELESGDLLMIPHGLGHVLSDRVQAETEPLPEVFGFERI